MLELVEKLLLLLFFECNVVELFAVLVIKLTAKMEII